MTLPSALPVPNTSNAKGLVISFYNAESLLHAVLAKKAFGRDCSSQQRVLLLKAVAVEKELNVIMVLRSKALLEAVAAGSVKVVNTILRARRSSSDQTDFLYHGE
jgi:hypothetical protein